MNYFSSATTYTPTLHDTVTEDIFVAGLFCAILNGFSHSFKLGKYKRSLFHKPTHGRLISSFHSQLIEKKRKNIHSDKMVHFYGTN